MVRSFWLAAERAPERIALIDIDGSEVSAGELASSTNQLITGLRKRGLEQGDVVATLLPNGRAAIEVLLAAMQAGWHFTAINSHLTSAEIAHIIEDSGAKAFFSDGRYTEQACRSAELAGLSTASRYCSGEISSFTSMEAVRAGQPRSRPDNRSAGQFMQYTSGTTGRPKAVRRQTPPMDADEFVTLLAPNLTRYDIEPGGDDVHLVTSPMYHMAPLSFGYFSLHFEHTLVLMETWDPETALALIERHRVTTSHMVPTQFHRLWRLPEEVKNRYDVSSLRNVMHAAAPCPVDLKRNLLDWWGPVIYEYYGATEGGGTMVRPREWLEYPGTVGRPWPGADVKIFDDEGKELGAGEIGTVYMKLAMAFEYKDDPKKTRENRIGDYFTVGDVGELNQEGYLFLRDRKIDMIISGGVNIYPAEIEAALLGHPDVGDAAVFGIPHDEWGEEVKAVVEPASGVTRDGLADRLMAHCRDHLAKYKCPRSIDMIDALPRDPNGKLYKRRLRDPYWADRKEKI